MDNQQLPQKADDDNVSPQQNTPETNAESSNVVSVSERYLFSAPLPPPHALAEYERVMPGLSERIVRMAEKE